MADKKADKDQQAEAEARVAALTQAPLPADDPTFHVEQYEKVGKGDDSK